MGNGATQPVGGERTGPTVLGYFLSAQDSRRALNGLQKYFRDLRVQPLPEPVAGRSWCLTGHMPNTLERLLITTVIERWNGKVADVESHSESPLAR